jgi:hypothetical protein
MNDRLHHGVGDDAQSALSLEAWDAEGGALPDPAPAGAGTPTALSAAERRLLRRLGAALVGEWNHLPMPLKRSLYERAVHGACDPSTLKRRMARFLHDHNGVRQPTILS